MLRLKIASVEDREDLERMAKAFHSMSPYRDQEYNREKVLTVIDGILSAPREAAVCLVLLDDDKPVGMIAGLIAPCFFNWGVTATELVWWLEPEYRRGSAGLWLEDGFEGWAKHIGCKYVSMVALEDGMAKLLGRHYTRRGYTKTENTYVKEI